MKCTFIVHIYLVQFNDYYLKLERWKQKESQLAISFSLSEVFNDINNNWKIIALPTLSLYMNQVQKITVYIKNKKGERCNSLL